ncbi:MAG: Peptidase in kexin sedolisin [Chlorobi bacterium]|nr:Peptidase in kexin sedolisin [Chlorobiota bacterium]
MRLSTLLRRFLPPNCVLIIGVLLFGHSMAARAQSPALDSMSSGTKYVIAFPDTTINGIDIRYPNTMTELISVLLYSSVDNKVTLVGKHINKTVDLKAGKFSSVMVNTSPTLANNVVSTNIGVPGDNTILVQSVAPVVVYCTMMTKFGAEGFTPIPVDKWGKEYFAAAMPGDIVIDMSTDQAKKSIHKNLMASAEVLIIAAYDGTQVNISATGKLLDAPPVSVMLNAGQTYQVRSFVDTVVKDQGTIQPDIAGTYISASRPIGVISGNTRTQATTDAAAVTNNALKGLAVEWLVPTEQYGKRFVYLPTWDTRHITGEKGEKLAEKRAAEVVRVYGANAAGTTVYYQKDAKTIDSGVVLMSRTRDYRITTNRPCGFRTTNPAQVMMNCGSVIRFNGTVSGRAGSGNYDCWTSYMVEVTPQEQWTSFAPYYAPPEYSDMTYYINVVADTNAQEGLYDETGAPFIFNQGPIPGTGYIWASYPVTPGVTHFIESRTDSRFAAYICGLRNGYEIYTPDILTGRPPKVTTPSTYQEKVGLSMGFPLAPERNILRVGDTLKIDTTPQPCGLTIKIHATNTSPLGLRSVTLDSGSVNAQVITISPVGAGGVVGYSDVELSVIPSDPAQDAHGTVVITDRAGKISRVGFNYMAEHLEPGISGQLDFGDVNNNSMKDTTIVVMNNSARPVVISNTFLLYGNRAMRVISTDPPGPAQSPAKAVTIPPGGMFHITVEAAPTVKNLLYIDTIRVKLSCTELRIPTLVGAAVPCLTVGDLNFGTLDTNEWKTLPLQICNKGRGTISFANPSGPGQNVITWISESFSISSGALDSLKATQLGPNQCITIPVSYGSPAPDSALVVARLWASTRDCRDTSIWSGSVKVKDQGINEVETSVAGYAIERIDPNPFSGSTSINFRLGSGGHTSLEIYNAVGVKVATLFQGNLGDGEHTITWNAATQPSGVYYCRIASGSWNATRLLMVRR